LDCAIYVNGRLSGHSVAAASVAYTNSDLVFGVDYMNNTNYLSGSMDHVAIYSQFFGDVNVAALYSAGLYNLPTEMPSSNLATNGGQSKSGCDVYCMIGIIVGLVGVVLSICGIIAAYHIFYMQRQWSQNSGNNFQSVATRDATYRI